jgi:hypothetical protein
MPLVFAVLLASAAAAGAAKTDIVLMRNGDRITCEVTQMRQGKLQVKTDDAGTISIEWDEIASVTTATEYDVTLRDGTRLLGRLAPGAASTVQVSAAAGTPAVVPLADIVSFTIIKKGFWHRIDGSLDLGGSYTQSSGVADVYFDTQATYRRPAFAYAASFSTTFTRQRDADNTSRNSLKLSYTRFRDNNWVASALGLFESNRELGFTFRGTGGGTVGRYLVRSKRVEALLAGGLAGGQEAPVDAPTATNVDAMAVLDVAVFSYDYPSTRLDVSVLLFPSLNDPGRVRANASLKVKRELFHDFFFNLTGYDAIDNRPPSAGARQNDFGTSVSFGWTF